MVLFHLGDKRIRFGCSDPQRYSSSWTFFGHFDRLIPKLFVDHVRHSKLFDVEVGSIGPCISVLRIVHEM